MKSSLLFIVFGLFSHFSSFDCQILENSKNSSVKRQHSTVNPSTTATSNSSSIRKRQKLINPGISLAIYLDMKNKTDNIIVKFTDSFLHIPPICDSILKNLNPMFRFSGCSDRKLDIHGNYFTFGNETELKFGFRIAHHSPPIKQLKISWIYLDSGVLTLIYDYIRYCNEELISLTFENCNFSPISTVKLKYFNIKSLKVFKMKNCSINERNINRLFMFLPEDLDHLNLSGIRWKSGKVNLKFPSFEKFQSLSELFLDDMLLSGKDEIILNLSHFKKLKTLSLLKDKINSFSFPDIQALTSLETFYMSENSFTNFFTSISFKSVFSNSVKVILDPSIFKSSENIFIFVNRFKMNLFECEIMWDKSNYLFSENCYLSQLSSHNVVIGVQDNDDSFFAEFIKNLRCSKERNLSFNLNHIKKLSIYGNLMRTNIQSVLNFLDFLPELQILDLNLLLVDNSVVQIVKDNLSKLPKKIKKLKFWTQHDEFVIEILRNYPNIEEIEFAIINQKFASDLVNRLEVNGTKFKKLSKFQCNFFEGGDISDMNFFIQLALLPTVKFLELRIDGIAKQSEKLLEELKSIKPLQTETLHLAGHLNQQDFQFMKILFEQLPSLTELILDSFITTENIDLLTIIPNVRKITFMNVEIHTNFSLIFDKLIKYRHLLSIVIKCIPEFQVFIHDVFLEKKFRIYTALSFIE